jgi:hypothetical protein
MAAFLQAVDKDRGKFSPGAVTDYPNRQTNDKVTVAARPYIGDEEAREAFGKVNPYKQGVLPVLVVMQNDSGQAFSLESLRVDLITVDREKVEATPSADLRYLSGPAQPKMTPGPIPGRGPRVPKNKKALDAWEIEGRAFSARMLPPNESASGFFYFQVPFRAGAKLFVTGIREASTGKELFYFELPLERK